jgi:hypothetical protein
MIYLIIKRHFNRLTAFVVSLWAALFSVVVFSDTLGMQEQLGLVLLFAGILAWPRFSWLTGFLWVLASMVRSEYWLFSVALVIAAFFDRTKKSTEKKVVLFFAYLFPLIVYMKYMIIYTKNPIFPIYWNYLASVSGEWFENLHEPLKSSQIVGQWFGRSLFTLGIIGALFTIYKRSRHFLFFLLGFFNVIFIGFMFGFAAYIHGFFERFYVDRLLAFPYLFLGIIVIIFFLYWLPNKTGRLKKPMVFVGIGVSVLLIIASQSAWGLILKHFRVAQAGGKNELARAAFVAEGYTGGRLLFPADRPALTYYLVYNHHVPGELFLGDMYDPYYYAEGDETKKELQEAVFEWLEREEVDFIVFSGKKEYSELIDENPSRFKHLGREGDIVLFKFFR